MIARASHCGAQIPLVDERKPPPNRRAYCDGTERHLPEAAVMLAYAMHLAETVPALREVRICPDGEHGKRFRIRAWLEGRGFRLVAPGGKTDYGGRYERDGFAVVVDPASGKGDVAANADGIEIVAECKGGVLNTRHPGQVSRLARGLCEAVGQLMKRAPGSRQVVVVPRTKGTLTLAKQMAPRCRRAGIEIALVKDDGSVCYVGDRGAGGDAVERSCPAD